LLDDFWKEKSFLKMNQIFSGYHGMSDAAVYTMRGDLCFTYSCLLLRIGSGAGTGGDEHIIISASEGTLGEYWEALFEPKAGL